MSYYNGSSYTFTWNGRNLASASKNGILYSFVYNSDGLRTEKTVNRVVHTYYYSGTQLLAEEWNVNLLVFLYDARGGVSRSYESWAEGVSKWYFDLWR